MVNKSMIDMGPEKKESLFCISSHGLAIMFFSILDTEWKQPIMMNN